jgi:uncharacterized protein
MTFTPPNPEFTLSATQPVGAQPPAEDRGRVAPMWHTIVFVVVTLALTGLQARHQPKFETLNLPTHTPVYIVMIGFELIMLLYVWIGIRSAGKNFRDIIGGRWNRLQDFGLDVAIAFGFWFVVAGFLIAMNVILGKNNAGMEAVKALLPRTPIEMIAWVCLSVTAGFCEEFIFRGYLQRQFLAMTGKVELAVVFQAFIFGVAHMYQGWKGALTITVYGALFGALAAWRKSLRPGMIQHAAQDTFSGLVGSFVLRHHKF